MSTSVKKRFLINCFIQVRLAGEELGRRLELYCRHNAPFFSHFEIRLRRGKRKRIKGDSITVNLPPGRTRIEARTVEKTRRAGPAAYIVIQAKEIKVRSDL